MIWLVEAGHRKQIDLVDLQQFLFIRMLMLWNASHGLQLWNPDSSCLCPSLIVFGMCHVGLLHK